jgi:hypothetical protein
MAYLERRIPGAGPAYAINLGTYYRADLSVTADVFSVKELGYGEGRRVYFTWRSDNNGNSGLDHLPECAFAAVYAPVANTETHGAGA